MNEKILNLYVRFCQQEFGILLYDYQVEIARELLSSLIIWPHDVAVKEARQSGKTENITLLVRFLIVFLRHFLGSPLMAGVASPKGEQAKTDVDRVKKSMPLLRQRWQIEDREFNTHTVRAYQNELLMAEIFRFSLSPTTQNESKSLNLLIIEEAHNADDQKRSNELDPMLAQYNGVTWSFGVGCTRLCDFKRASDGELPETTSLKVDVQRVIDDHRRMFDRTGDSRHLDYEKAFEREIRKKGRQNPEIRRNYYLEDTVEEGNFVSRERLLSCSRAGGIIIPFDQLFLGLDWGRVSDQTIATVGNNQNDVLDWFAYPKTRYEEQIELLVADLKQPRRRQNGNGVEEEFDYFSCIVGVRGDSTGMGDFPMEFLQSHSGLPVGNDSLVKFTLQSKHEMYTKWEQAIYREPGDPMRFSYPADHPLAPTFEEQTIKLEREYKGDGEYLSVHHPDEPGGRDDYPDATALFVMSASSRSIGEILFA